MPRITSENRTLADRSGIKDQRLLFGSDTNDNGVLFSPALIAQSAEAADLKSAKCGFESHLGHVERRKMFPHRHKYKLGRVIKFDGFLGEVFKSVVYAYYCETCGFPCWRSKKHMWPNLK